MGTWRIFHLTLSLKKFRIFANDFIFGVKLQKDKLICPLIVVLFSSVQFDCTMMKGFPKAPDNY